MSRLKILKVFILSVFLAFPGSSLFALELPTKALTVLVPIPSYGFDPTEASVPWKYVKDAGYKIVFATPNGKPGRADARMATGQDLGLLKSVLMNDENGTKAYQELLASNDFNNPISYQDIRSQDFDAILLPGGHDKGMREYLGSPIVQKIISEFFAANKPVGAICHGTLVVGRSKSQLTGRSVLWGRKTTGLTRNQELISYNLTKMYLGDYYRTYPELDTKDQTVTMGDELRAYLKSQEDFAAGPGFPIPVQRDSPTNLSPGFVVLDGNYLSARWPGDAHKFGTEFVRLLKNYSRNGNNKKVYFLKIPSLISSQALILRVGEYLPPGPISGDVLYLPGFADRLDNHEPLFEEFNKQGFRVISFDYPSHGETFGEMNSLDYFSFSDLSHLAKYVEVKTQTDSRRPLVFAGWSTGGLLAIRMFQSNAFSSSARKPAGLILYAPGVSVHPLVGKWRVVTERTLTHNPRPPHLGSIKPKSPLEFPAFAAKLLTNAELAQLETLPANIPTLIFVGSPTADKYVKTQNVLKWTLSQRQKGVPIFGIQCPNAAHELDNEPTELGGAEVRFSSGYFLNLLLIHQTSSMELIAQRVCKII